MKSSKKFMLLSLIFSTLLLFVGCSSSENTDSTSEALATETTEQTAGNGSAVDEEIATLVKSSCSGCHGSDYKGGMAPALVGTKLSKEEIVNILKNGKNSMPAGLASGKEEQVADYILTLK